MAFGDEVLSADDGVACARRDAHAEAEKLTAGSIPERFHFYNFEESVLDRSEDC